MKTLKRLLLAVLIVAIASPANACVCQLEIDVEKMVDPEVSKVGDEVIYGIVVSNPGPKPVRIVEVYDDLLGDLTSAFLPGEILLPGELVGGAFPYEIQPEDPDPLVNTVTVTATDVNECCEVICKASAVVDLVHPDFTVEKECPPVSKVGDEICCTMTIHNTGDTPLEILEVEDSIFGPLGPGPDDCVGVILFPGDTCVDGFPGDCSFVIPPDAPDPLVNILTVRAQVVGLPNILERESEPCVTDLVHPSIEITKTVDPCEACPGETVIYTICIKNTGDWPLENIVVTDPNLGGILPGFPPALSPGEVSCNEFPYEIPEDIPTCPYLLVNCAQVTANPVGLPNVIDANDCATICCPPSPPGEEGCTPGFWKNNADKHGASAWCDLFSPSMRIGDVFMLNEPLVIRGNGKSTITDPTLLQALDANGDGVNAMIRHGIAALLNACSDCVNFQTNNPFEIIFMIEDALNGIGLYTVDELHSMFAEYNEAGCPVNQHGECVGVENEIDG